MAAASSDENQGEEIRDAGAESAGSANADPAHQGNLMQRMTDALSRMLNDPSTRYVIASYITSIAGK